MHKKGYDMSIEELLIMSQQELYTMILGTYKLHTIEEDYIIYSNGDNVIKPLLCVHLDTINTVSSVDTEMSLKDIYLDIPTNTIHLHKKSKMRCLGGDDRAGVWIALQVIKWMETNDVYPYDIGFFCDEEKGGDGSSKYLIDNPTDKYSCYIGLDRRTSTIGTQEVATYGYDNEELISIFADLGYVETMGSFTDASNIAHDKACINLCVGYHNEHSNKETLNLTSMWQTLSDLKNVVIPSKVFEARSTYDRYDYSYDSYDEADTIDYDEVMYENYVFRNYLTSIGLDPEDILNTHYY